jgi:hypothetical protein
VFLLVQIDERVNLRLWNNIELHRKHVAHLGGRSDAFAHIKDVVHLVFVHQVSNSVNFHDDLAIMKLMMAMLKAERESLLKAVLEEDVAKGSFQQIVDLSSLKVASHLRTDSCTEGI